jgi:hypothetical protein
MRRLLRGRHAREGKGQRQIQKHFLLPTPVVDAEKFLIHEALTPILAFLSLSLSQKK